MTKIASLFSTISILCCLLLSSCSVTEKVKKVFVPKKDYISVSTPATNTADIETPTAVLEEIETIGDRASQPTLRRSRLTDRNLEGEWAIISAYGQKINLYTLPYIEFSPAEGKIYGSTGCNIVNGDYMVTRNNGLSFNNIISSERSCNTEKYEAAILKALSRAVSYEYIKTGGMLYLNIFDKKAALIMTLKQHNLNVLNGTWKVAEIGDNHINNDNIKLNLDIIHSKLHGNSGCNIINGTINLDSKKNNSIQFSAISSTRKACRDMAIETDLLVALEEVEYYTVRDKNNIDLSNSKGEIILTLKK